MKFVQCVFAGSEEATAGVKVGAEIVNLSAADAAFPATVLEILQHFDELKEKIAAVVASGDHRVAEDAVVLDAPIRGMERILCVGMNYKDHCEEQDVPLPKIPLIFNKFPSCITATNTNIIKTPEMQKLDYEVELAIVIGKDAYRVEKGKGSDYIFGYTVTNDVSERMFQLEQNGGQWLLGKGCDTFAPLGPCIVTKDEVDVDNLNVFSRVNGEVRQNSNTTNLVHKCSDVVEHISKFFTLHPGDLIFTGTPGGVGCFLKPEPIFLKNGDVVEVEIEGIGKITNTVVDLE